MKIVPLPDGVTYADATTAIRRLNISVDAWPVPPAGLFVSEERTVYLRIVTSMTIVHELGHALDCALGGGTYLSGIDTMIRRASENATQFVTPYAASGLDEFFAENWRAYLGANDPHSFWPTVTRARLEARADDARALQRRRGGLEATVGTTSAALARGRAAARLRRRAGRSGHTDPWAKSLEPGPRGCMAQGRNTPLTIIVGAF